MTKALLTLLAAGAIAAGNLNAGDYQSTVSANINTGRIVNAIRSLQGESGHVPTPEYDRLMQQHMIDAQERARESELASRQRRVEEENKWLLEVYEKLAAREGLKPGVLVLKAIPAK